MKLILVPFHSACASAACIEMRRSISSGEKSRLELPSSTRACRDTCLVSNRTASRKLVLPVSWWPTRATLRILPISYAFKSRPPPGFASRHGLPASAEPVLQQRRRNPSAQSSIEAPECQRDAPVHLHARERLARSASAR